VLTSIADPHSVGYLDERAFANGIILALSKRVRSRDAKVINCHILHHTHLHITLDRRVVHMCGCKSSAICISLSPSQLTHSQACIGVNIQTHFLQSPLVPCSLFAIQSLIMIGFAKTMGIERSSVTEKYSCRGS
jgi:hypothetical protein